MPWDYFKMKWCREWGWTPAEFDQMKATDFEKWQAMLEVEASYRRQRQQLEKAEAQHGG